MEGNKKSLLIGSAFLGLAIVGIGYLWWSMRSNPLPSKLAPIEQTSEELIENNKPSSIKEKLESENTGEEPSGEPQLTDEELLSLAFAEKYQKPINDVDINISEKNGPYARGGVRFAGEIGGAMWLAYKEGQEWLIVFDGQGTIPCEAVDPYDFPVEMVSECWNEANSQLIQR